MSVLEKIFEEVKDLKEKQNSSNQDYATGYLSALSTVEGIISGVKENDGWIPVDSDDRPKDEERVLVSFENFNVVLTARYKAEEEGGTFLLDADDTDESFASHDLYVSAWQPLPNPYKGE